MRGVKNSTFKSSRTVKPLLFDKFPRGEKKPPNKAQEKTWLTEEQQLSVSVQKSWVRISASLHFLLIHRCRKFSFDQLNYFSSLGKASQSLQWCLFTVMTRVWSCCRCCCWRMTDPPWLTFPCIAAAAAPTTTTTSSGQPTAGSPIVAVPRRRRMQSARAWSPKRCHTPLPNVVHMTSGVAKLEIEASLDINFLGLGNN